MDCPHCKRSFAFNDCIQKPGAEPRDGDIGMCFGCGGWWEMADNRPRTYTPTREEMEGAYPHLLASRQRWVEEQKRQLVQSAKRKTKKAT